jgi:peptidoglycan/xylan/chitin deacetylase (PgdA/CDA1 family)
MMKRSLLIAILFLSSLFSYPQAPAWNGKKCAVVLTYDDALIQHLDHAIPVLDSLGLKATFYLTISYPGCQQRIDDWKKAATSGHELGNHTWFHPCVGKLPGREWVSEQQDLNNYTVEKMVNEIRRANKFLQTMDGKTKRSFAFTCGDMKLGDTLFIDRLRNDFVAARAVRNQMHRINEIDLFNVDGYMVNNHTADQMIEWVKKAMETNSLLVILFHGVGGGNSLNVSLDEHRKFLSYLNQNQKDLVIAPMVEVAELIKNWQTRDSIRVATQKKTQEDYNNMLAQLGIKSTRPGPSGNPQAPNAANVDESKASPYTTLPDPLEFKNGHKVTSKKLWMMRRKELFEDFDREIYGRVPKNMPKVIWEVLKDTIEMNGSFKQRTKKLLGRVDNSSFPPITVKIDLTLSTPADAKKAVPVIMEFGFSFPPGFRLQQSNSNESTWQQQLLAKGWGYAIIVPTSFQADNGAGLTEGIIGLVNKGQRRKPDDWGTLRAWAWGASCALDYFETDKNVDAKQVGIEGLSRYGKAAIVSMAYDPRFAIGFIGSSGAGGVKILRRVFGEQVENLSSPGEYHWFAGNFIKYAGPLTANDLPVDAHELVALCAPRPLFISSGSLNVEGSWVDAKGMFLGAVHAGPVYKLLGKKDLGTTEMPAEQNALVDGELAFRQHGGGHTTGPNWPVFIRFAERYFK